MSATFDVPRTDSAMRTAPGPAANLLRLEFAHTAYYIRIAGLGIAFIMFAGVMVGKDASVWRWLGPALYCFGWPHLAWALARRAANPAAAERRNLVTDHFLIGAFMVAMEFNQVPCILASALTCMNSLAGGGWRLLTRGLMYHALGVLAGVAVYGFAWQIQSSPLTVLASVPLMVFHPLAIGHMAFKVVTTLNQKRLEAERLSRQDGLSGLNNRMYWEHLVRAEFARFRRSGEVAVLAFCDLDHFKRINDTYGHAAGDEVIRRLAASFNRVLRETDISGRTGGEEFGILFTGTTTSEAVQVIERLRADIQKYPLLDEELVTASFGLAELASDLQNVEQWMQRADRMLYQSKHGGRDRVSEFAELN